MGNLRSYAPSHGRLPNTIHPPVVKKNLQTEDQNFLDKSPAKSVAGDDNVESFREKTRRFDKL